MFHFKQFITLVLSNLYFPCHYRLKEILIGYSSVTYDSLNLDLGSSLNAGRPRPANFLEGFSARVVAFNTLSPKCNI